MKPSVNLVFDTDDANRIKIDLLDQLERNRMHGKHYSDMVDKYMDFWYLHAHLKDVIDKEGRIVPTSSGFKMNPAIEALNKNNNQMLRIITTLGLKEPPVPKDDDFDEDDL